MTSQSECEKFEAQLRAEFINYPEEPPILSVSAPSLAKSRKSQLESDMSETFVEGETNIIECAELLREALNENYTPEEEEPAELEPITQKPSLPKLKIYSNEPIIDRKSIFQAFYADISTAADAERFRQQLLENNKIASATHNMFVWKVNENGVIKSDSDEDGESGAASRMMHLVDLTGAINFAVIVTR